MPRLTYCPSRSSCATRAASWVLVSGIAALPRRDAFDAFALRADAHDALHEDAGEVHLFRIDLARLDQLFNLHDGDVARHRAQRIEVARRFVKDEITGAVPNGRAYQRVIADDTG